MIKRVAAVSISAIALVALPMSGALGQWSPGAELVNQTVQVETNGVVNSVHFAPNGVAHITSPAGRVVEGSWSAAGGQLCLSAGGAQECWPYQSAFQAGQAVSLVSSCQVASRWTPLGTNPVQASAGERG